MLQMSISFVDVSAMEKWMESHADATTDELYITYYRHSRCCSVHVWSPETQSVYYLETSGEFDELETIKMIYGWYQGSIRVK